MGRRSSIDQLDPRIREAVDRLVREDAATIDDIVAAIDRLGGTASRSAVGRYVQRTRDQMERYREAQQMARVWVGRLEEDPEGDVGRLLSEMLRTVAWQQLATMGEGEDLQTKELAALARAIKDLASADKLAAERELRIRRDVATQAAKAAEDAGRTAGLSGDTVAVIKARILGVAA